MISTSLLRLSHNQKRILVHRRIGTDQNKWIYKSQLLESGCIIFWMCLFHIHIHMYMSLKLKSGLCMIIKKKCARVYAMACKHGMERVNNGQCARDKYWPRWPSLLMMQWKGLLWMSNVFWTKKACAHATHVLYWFFSAVGRQLNLICPWCFSSKLICSRSERKHCIGILFLFRCIQSPYSHSVCL